MTNQQTPEIYTLHTVSNKGERPWCGIYGVRADAEHDAKVMRDVTGRDWSVVRLVVADTNDRVPEAWTNVLAYVLHNRLTPRVIDIAYTAFMQAKRPNNEDGSASDWFNDTRPVVRELIAKLRKDLIKELAGAPQSVPSATVALSDDLRDGLVAISKAVADQDDRAAQAMLREILAAPQPSPTPKASFQQRVQPWLLECFGAEIAADRMERNHRFLEESLELVQSLGCTASEAHQLVDYVFGRPVGDPPQEVGGVMVTLAALCLASSLDMHDAGEVELTRISAPEVVAKIRAKQAAKPKHSPLPQAPTPQADSQPALPEITAEDRLFLHYNPNTGDIVKWVHNYARAAITAALAASPTPPAEQQAQPGVVYAVLPLSVGEHKYGGGLFTEAQMRDFADHTHALRMQAAPKAATQQAGEVRRAELVPGVMHCAKCKFQLNRVTLCVSDGNAYAGNNKTEPCPNGCGPLWPVTWEQEAKNCWKALEEMHERLMAAAAPQPSPTAQAAESVPAIQGEMNVQLDIDSNHSAPGQQRDVARSVALGQPMGNGQDQAAGRPSAQGDKLLTVAKRNIRSFLRSAQFKSESDREAALNCVDVLWAAARDPADGVLEDAVRLDWLDQQCEVYGFQDIHEGNCWEISGPYANVRVAIDAERAARKKGGRDAG